VQEKLFTNNLSCDIINKNHKEGIMKNDYSIKDGVVTMNVQGKQVIFDETDVPIIEKYKWKLSRNYSANTGYRDENGVGRTLTLHKLLTGSKYVERVNGDLLDYRRCNLIPTDKVIQRHERGVNLKGNKCHIDKKTVIVLIKSKGEIHEAYVDYEDYPLISNYTWCRNVVSGYAQTIDRITKKGIYMHRLVMNATDEEIDHINGNPLDNRKCNLRFCSSSQNKHNNLKHRKGIAGVSRHIDGGWDVRLQFNGVINRKYFKSFDDAVAQYKQWEKEFNPSGLRNADT
jgi:hypothetical protein